MFPISTGIALLVLSFLILDGGSQILIVADRLSAAVDERSVIRLF